MTLDLVRSEDLSTWTLEKLVSVANEEHVLCIGAATDALTHAIRAGEALTVARERVGYQGGWIDWVHLNTEMSPSLAAMYMRVARLREQIPPHIHSIALARAYLVGVPKAPGIKGYPEDVREEARRLRAEGVAWEAIAEVVGASVSTVRIWCDRRAYDNWRKHKIASATKRRQADAALAKQQALDARAAAAKKVGGSLGEAYSTLRIHMQALDRAIEEAEDRETKAVLRSALGFANKVNYKIVEALGVS